MLCTGKQMVRPQNGAGVMRLMASCVGWCWLAAGLSGPVVGQTRCEVVPLDGHQVAFTIDGVEKLRWNFGEDYPRPYFFPLHGPAGGQLTRMGHPGAPDHDHHQSVWFAHHKVGGWDFWSNRSQTRVRQQQWLAYQDGAEEAVMAVRLAWLDPQGREVLQQELIVALMPVPPGGLPGDAAGDAAEKPVATGVETASQDYALELQSRFSPGRDYPQVELEQTNFGFLAVRVAKSLSAHFGGGQLTNSEGGVGEQACFGKAARWMDYSGPLSVGLGPQRQTVTAGITFYDHPHNPRYPTHWHVRQDGWMGAAFGLAEPAHISAAQPLELRYLLLAHQGVYEPQRAEQVAAEFAKRPPLELVPKPQPHVQFGVRRQPR